MISVSRVSLAGVLALAALAAGGLAGAGSAPSHWAPGDPGSGLSLVTPAQLAARGFTVQPAAPHPLSGAADVLAVIGVPRQALARALPPEALDPPRPLLSAIQAKAVARAAFPSQSPIEAELVYVTDSRWGACSSPSGSCPVAALLGSHRLCWAVAGRDAAAPAPRWVWFVDANSGVLAGGARF